MPIFAREIQVAVNGEPVYAEGYATDDQVDRAAAQRKESEGEGWGEVPGRPTRD